MAKAGRIEEAIALFQEALRLDPSVDLDPSTPEIEQDAGAIAYKFFALTKVREGEGLAREGEIEEAIALFQEALRLDPSVDLDPWTEELEQDAGAIANKFAEIGPSPFPVFSSPR